MFRCPGITYPLAALLLVSACKSKSQETAPAPAPMAEAPAKPVEFAPLGEDTLSFLEKVGKQCRWVRLDALRGNRRDIFTFDGPCERAQLSWSHDNRRGAVLLQSLEQSQTPRAWIVDFATGQGTELPLPDMALTTELSFDPEGLPVALVSHYDRPGLQPPERRKKNGQEFFVFEGQEYPIDDLYLERPGLAHAYLREGSAWTREETIATGFEHPLNDGTLGLQIVRILGPSTAYGGISIPTPVNVTAEEKAAIEKTLTSADIRQEGGHWASYERIPGTPLYHWAKYIDYPDTPNPLLPLRWKVDGKIVEPEKLELPPGSKVSFAPQGDVLLITTDDAAGVYDAKHKKHLYSLQGIRHLRFWPRPELLRMELSNPQYALAFLEHEETKLEEGKEDCTFLKEHQTLGKLVKKVLAEATESSARCEGTMATKTWSCTAKFVGRSRETPEPYEYSLQLEYSVDDIRRTIKPGSLVCRM